ncbi:MAG: nucleoside deaminase [Chitinophagales bacterium]|nr:nucleoside deaminase [Chitinophagales bacterium]
MTTDHAHFMRQALNEAQRAFEDDEIPVGAVVVCQNRIIARAHNQTERLTDVTAHAEMLALTAAAHHLGAKYLPDCTLYVTLEPCTMCGGALYWAQIGTVVFGANDDKRGYRRWQYQQASILHPKTKVITNILADECSQVIQRFFAQKRQ